MDSAGSELLRTATGGDTKPTNHKKQRRNEQRSATRKNLDCRRRRRDLSHVGPTCESSLFPFSGNDIVAKSNGLCLAAHGSAGMSVGTTRRGGVDAARRCPTLEVHLLYQIATAARSSGADSYFLFFPLFGLVSRAPTLDNVAIKPSSDPSLNGSNRSVHQRTASMVPLLYLYFSGFCDFHLRLFVVSNQSSPKIVV